LASLVHHRQNQRTEIRKAAEMRNINPVPLTPEEAAEANYLRLLAEEQEYTEYLSKQSNTK
jgi:hypothetical protein